MKSELETRIVILEAALSWIRHESRDRSGDPRAMARIAAIATRVLDEDRVRSMTSIELREAAG